MAPTADAIAVLAVGADGQRQPRTLLSHRPLGPIDATFYASEHENGKFGARLLFNVQKQR